MKALRYGKSNEPKAFNQYSATINKNESLEITGLWVNQKYPELGCSPDGILATDEKITGFLEIKCPFVLENIHPSDIQELNPKQRYGLCYIYHY